jgi:hypothetical protein
MVQIHLDRVVELMEIYGEMTECLLRQRCLLTGACPQEFFERAKEAVKKYLKEMPFDLREQLSGEKQLQKQYGNDYLNYLAGEALKLR